MRIELNIFLFTLCRLIIPSCQIIILRTDQEKSFKGQFDDFFLLKIGYSEKATKFGKKNTQ